MNKLNPTKPGFGRWTKAVKLAIGTLILCLEMLFSGKSIASTISPDSLRPLETKPIRLTEAGARQVLKDKADLLMLQGVLLSQDTLLRQQRQAIDAQNLTIQQLNERQQQEKNQGTTAQYQLAHYQTKWRGARLENWLWRAGLVVYVAVRFKLL